MGFLLLYSNKKIYCVICMLEDIFGVGCWVLGGVGFGGCGYWGCLKIFGVCR